MKEKHRNGIIYSSKSIYVDVDTGEVIRLNDVIEKKYIIIKTTKHVEHKSLTRQHITYTRECRKQPQGSLF